MQKTISSYFKLKNKQKLVEEQLQALKSEIIHYMQEQQLTEHMEGSYKVRLVVSQRKEFDEGRLYDKLPDKELWRLLSKPDLSKINGLIKLGVLTEQHIDETFELKPQLALYVDKK